MNKKLSRFLAVCMALAVMVSSISAFALPADEAETTVDPEILAEAEAVQPRGVQYYMDYTAEIRNSYGDALGIYAYEGEDVDSDGDFRTFAQTGTTLHRDITTVDRPIRSGWVPNAAVTSRYVSG